MPGKGSGVSLTKHDAYGMCCTEYLVEEAAGGENWLL